MKIDTKDLYETVKLKDLKNNLPIYRLDHNGKPIENLSFKFMSWDMEMEELISAKQDKAKNIGEFVREMFMLILDEFGGVDFQSMKEDQKILLINQLEFSNVMYMYMYLRYEELGEDLALSLSCPTCRKQIKDYVADLGTLDVNVKRFSLNEGEEGTTPRHPRKQRYELHTPIQIGDSTITAFEVDMPKWDYMEKVKSDDGVGQSALVKKLMLLSSIHGFFSGDKRLDKFFDVKEVVKKLKKRDIEQCMHFVTVNNAGPEMTIGGDCPHCSKKFFKVLNWTYESFFDSSSL